MDRPEKSLDERFAILLRRVETIENRVGGVEGELRRETREARQHASRQAEAAESRMAERVSQLERSALQVRVSDALWFGFGVTFALAGALLAALC
jgi:hypothetical protein